MENALYAADGVYSLLFLVAGVLAALQSRRDLWIARNFVVIGASIVAVRWGVWALTTDTPWLVRGVVGALIGATLFVLVPGVLYWLSERQAETSKATSNDRWTWNALTSSEIDELYSKLRKTPRASVDIACNRAECTALADSFDNLFRRLGWPSAIGDGGIFAVGVTGIYIGPSDEVAKALKEAIETTTVLRPDLGQPRDKGTTHPIMLIIGTKPASLPAGPLVSVPAQVAPVAVTAQPTVQQVPQLKPPGADPHIAWYRPDDVESIFGFLQAPDGSMLVSNLSADGTNKTQSPITDVKSWFEPQLSKEPLTLEFINYDPAVQRDFIPTAERYIEPGANFGLGFLVPRIDSKSPRGVSVADFLRIYGGLTFHFEYKLDGVPQEYSRVYSYETIANLLSERERKWNEDHRRRPGLQEYK